MVRSGTRRHTCRGPATGMTTGTSSTSRSSSSSASTRRSSATSPRSASARSTATRTRRIEPAFFTSDRDICQTSKAGKVLMGESRGWGDIYRWSIAFQWIDITGRPGRQGTRSVWSSTRRSRRAASSARRMTRTTGPGRRSASRARTSPSSTRAGIPDDASATGRSLAATVLGLATLTTAADAGPTHAGVAPDARLPDLAVLAPSRLGDRRSGLRAAGAPVHEHRRQRRARPVPGDGLRPEGRRSRLGRTSSPSASRSSRPTARSRTTTTTATMIWSGDGHDHWHVDRLPGRELNNLEAEPLSGTSRRPGSALRQLPVRSTLPAYYTTGDRSVCRTEPNGPGPMGISVKWGDIYPSTIAYQWIDITGVAERQYRLKIFADPATREAGGYLHRVERGEQHGLGEDPHRRPEREGPLAERRP